MSQPENKSNSKHNASNISNFKVCSLVDHGCKAAHHELTSFKEHCITEEHQRTLVKLAKQMIHKHKSNSSGDDIDREKITLRLLEHYKTFAKSTENLETITEQISQLVSDVVLMSDQQATLTEDINDINTSNLSQKEHIQATVMNQKILKQDLTSIKERIDYDNLELKRHTPDGTMIWKIRNVHEKMNDAISERQTSVYSPSFYTSDAGYKLSLRLYLNGDGTARETHLSLFLVVLRGKFDALLQWPFSYRVSFCLFDQRTLIESREANQSRHIIESFRPDTNSISFQRPRSGMNIAAGIPKFCPLVLLKQPEHINQYIINDIMFIKVFIDFIGTPRSMLPFIFSLNIALPKHAQQKLIDDELKHHQGRTSS